KDEEGSRETRGYGVALRDRVPSAAAPGVAAQDSPDRQTTALKNTVLIDGLVGVFGACGLEAAGRRGVGGNELPIEANGAEKKLFHSRVSDDGSDAVS